MEGEGQRWQMRDNRAMEKWENRHQMARTSSPD